MLTDRRRRGEDGMDGMMATTASFALASLPLRMVMCGGTTDGNECELHDDDDDDGVEEKGGSVCRKANEVESAVAAMAPRRIIIVDVLFFRVC
mmetsp:Transcript_41552/g.87178  ORF Transcript_41552/g.87178 Transcript_41552/m.87178 type:complete len:93 (-) Transcript_41552:20-298(-)